MKKFKEYLKILFYPFLLITIEFSLVFIFTIIFNLNTNLEVRTDSYIEKLNIFISNYKLLIVLISFIILLPIILKNNQINHKKINIIKIIFYTIMGMIVGISFNLLLYGLNKVVYFTNVYDANNYSNIIIIIITTGILGPILEELVFRGIVYKKLKKLVKPLAALIITGLLFGLFHGNIIQFLYAFLLNFILVKSYEKEENILVPIIIHSSANIITTLVLSFIIKLNLLYTFILCFIFILILIVLLKFMYNDKNIG